MYLNFHIWESPTPPEGLQEEVPDIYLQLIVNNADKENGMLVEDISDIADLA